MFGNLSKPKSDLDEGTVVQVDPISKTCRVKTLRGQALNQVQWTESVGNSSRGGDRVGPQMGDRVVLMYGLGYPLIFGFLPRPQSSENAFPVNIDSGQPAVSTGDYSAMGTLVVGDANKPQDIVNGDRVIVSEGGGLLGLLRGGSVIIKSSSLAQIFLSKLDDVVKIVSRNWEHYTDVGSDIVKNFQGRVYRYLGYSNQYSDAKIEAYSYHQYIGDTAAAEAVKTNYATPPSNVPATNNILFKEQVTQTNEVMHRTLDTSGTEEVYVTNGTTFTRRVGNASEVTISYGDQNTITISGPTIELQRADGATVIMDSSGIRMTYAGGEVNMSSGGVNTTFGSHFVNVTTSGVQLG